MSTPAADVDEGAALIGLNWHLGGTGNPQLLATDNDRDGDALAAPEPALPETTWLADAGIHVRRCSVPLPRLGPLPAEVFYPVYPY